MGIHGLPAMGNRTNPKLQQIESLMNRAIVEYRSQVNNAARSQDMEKVRGYAIAYVTTASILHNRAPQLTGRIFHQIFEMERPEDILRIIANI